MNFSNIHVDFSVLPARSWLLFLHPSIPDVLLSLQIKRLLSSSAMILRMDGDANLLDEMDGQNGTD